mgnify:CR=1 FL=1
MTDLDAHFEDGLFDCPNCGEAQGFQLISHGGSQRTIFVRRFFGGKGEPAFECDGCQGVTPVATALSNGTPIAAAALRQMTRPPPALSASASAPRARATRPRWWWRASR